MATNDKILQQVILEGGDDIIRQLKEVADAGQKAFASLGDAINKIGTVDVPTEAIQKNLKEVGDAGEAAFKRVVDAAKAPIATLSTDAINKDLKGIGDTGTAAFKQVADAAQNTPITLQVEQPKQALVTLGGTAKTVFGDITSFVTGTAESFQKLAKDILNVNTTLSKLAIGATFIGFAKKLSDSVEQFSNIFDGTAIEKALGKHAESADKKVFTPLGKAIESRIKDVDEFRAAILNFNDTLDTSINAFHRSVFGTPELEKSILASSLDLGNIDSIFKTMVTDASKLDLSSKATDIDKMTTALKMLGVEQINVSDKTIAALHVLGVAQSDTRNIFDNLAKGIQTQFEHIRKEINDTTLTTQRNALAVKSSALSLQSAQEHLSQIRSPQPETAAEKERLRLLGSQDEAAARLATRIKLEDEEKHAVLQLEQAQLAFQQAQKTAADASANSLENAIKLVNSLVSGVTVLGPKINATAENIAKGFVASLGPAATNLSAFDGSLKGLSTASSSVVPAMEKLADLFKGTGDAALNARIANILFGGSITKEVLNALSQGKQGLRDAFDLSQSIAGLQKNFSIDNLETFARQLQKIKDPAERLKIAVRELGETFGTALVDNLNKVPGGIRNALAPFDDFVVKTQQDQEAAKRFNEAMKSLRKVFADIGVASVKGTLDLGLFLAPFATPVITAFADGIRRLGIDFRELGQTLGAAVTPVIQDFFKLLQKAPDTQISTKWLLDLRDIVLDVGKVFSFVFVEVLLPALQTVKTVAGEVAKVFSGLFGADITANMVIVGAILTGLIGGFKTLALVVLALFSGKAGASIEGFKESLLSIGIDIDAIKENVKALANEFIAAFGGKVTENPIVNSIVSGLNTAKDAIKGFLGGAWDAFTKALSGKAAEVPTEFKWIADLTLAIKNFVIAIPAAIKGLVIFATGLITLLGPTTAARLAFSAWTGVLDVFVKLFSGIASVVLTVQGVIAILSASVAGLAAAFSIGLLPATVVLTALIALAIVFRKEFGGSISSIVNTLIDAGAAINKFSKELLGIDLASDTSIKAITLIAGALAFSLIPAIRTAIIALTVGLVGALQTTATAAIAFSRILLLTLIPALARFAIPIIAAVSAMALLLEAFNRFEKREVFAGIEKEIKDLQDQLAKKLIDPKNYNSQMDALQKRFDALVIASKTDFDKIKDFLQGVFKEGVIPEIKVPNIKGPENTDSVIDGLKNKWADGAKSISDIWKALFGDLAKTSSTPLPGPKVAATATGDRGINAQPGSRGGGEAGQIVAEIEAAIARSQTKVIQGPFKPGLTDEQLRSQTRIIDAFTEAEKQIRQGGKSLADAMDELAAKRFKEVTDKDKLSPITTPAPLSSASPITAPVIDELKPVLKDVAGLGAASGTTTTELDAASKALDQFNADIHLLGITIEDFKKTLSLEPVPVTAGPGQLSTNIEQGAPATAEQLKKAADDVILRELDDAINSLPQRIADALPVSQTAPVEKDVTLAELLDALNKLVVSGAKAGTPTSVVQNAPDFIELSDKFQKRIEEFPAEFTTDIREQLKLIFRGQAEEVKADLEKQIKTLEGTPAGNVINDEGITVLEGLKQQLSDTIHFIQGTIPPVTKELQELLDAEKARQASQAPQQQSQAPLVPTAPANLTQDFVDALRAGGPLPVKVDAATPISPEAAAREANVLPELEMLTVSFETGAGMLTEKGGGLFSSITEAVTSLTTFINSVITKVTTPPEGINARLAGAGVPESINIENTTTSSLDKLITISVASVQAAESLTEIHGVIAALRDAVAIIRDAVSAILAKIAPQQTAPQTAQQTTPTGPPAAVPAQAGVPQDLTQTLVLSVNGLISAIDIGSKVVIEAVTTGANTIVENQRGFSGELFNWLSAILAELKLVPKASTSVAKDGAQVTGATPAGDGTTSVADALTRLETILGALKDGNDSLIAAVKLGFTDLRSVFSDGVTKLQTINEVVKELDKKLDLIFTALGAIIILLAEKSPAKTLPTEGNFADWLKRRGPSSTSIDDRRDGSAGPDEFIPFGRGAQAPPLPPEMPIPGPTLANPLRWWDSQHPLNDQSKNANDPTFVKIVDPVKVTPAAPDTQGSFLFPGLPLLNQPSQAIAPQPIAPQSIAPQAAPGIGPASSLEPSLSRIEQAINSAITAINDLSGKMGSALEPLFSNVIQAINSSQAAINELSSNMGSALEPLFSNLVQVINGAVSAIREQGSAIDSAASSIVAAVESGAQSIVAAIETASSGGSTTATELASGGFTGFVRGPGTKTSDSILARISRGEFVHRAAAVDKYGLGFFHSINNLTFPKFSFGGIINKDDEDTKLLPKFNLGGMVSNFSSQIFPKFSLPRFDMGGFFPHIGQLAMGSVPSFASGGSTLDLTDVGRPSSSGRPLFLSIGGDKPVGPFTSGREHAVDAVERSAVKHRVTRIGPSPSWRTT